MLKACTTFQFDFFLVRQVCLTVESSVEAERDLIDESITNQLIRSDICSRHSRKWHEVMSVT